MVDFVRKTITAAQDNRYCKCIRLNDLHLINRSGNKRKTEKSSSSSSPNRRGKQDPDGTPFSSKNLPRNVYVGRFVKTGHSIILQVIAPTRRCHRMTNGLAGSTCWSQTPSGLSARNLEAEKQRSLLSVCGLV
ncbi:uncharacterized protein LOC120413296 [Culex pipiens pallens]|uniref:uncharacterized protein LOC120413296 n=1 Tax=Culex pipiens pallens TaxID=42434 RepID=UPI0019530182|nr:uncharacterized protein LOC120413296 [Culex pipiens pallens]